MATAIGVKVDGKIKYTHCKSLQGNQVGATCRDITRCLNVRFKHNSEILLLFLSLLGFMTFENISVTRQSSCVNARGIRPAAWQAHALLS